MTDIKEAQELEVVGYLLAKGRALSIWPANKDTDEPLCRLSEATAVIDQLKAENEQQAARIKELEKDADRYRWIEANSTYGIDYRQRPELTLPIYAPDHREGLDAAIDAAMGSKGE